MNTGHTNNPLRSRAPSPRVISLPCDAESVISDGTRAFKKVFIIQRARGGPAAGRKVWCPCPLCTRKSTHANRPATPRSKHQRQKHTSSTIPKDEGLVGVHRRSSQFG